MLLRMKDVILSSALKVTDPRVAAVFADPLRRRLILLLAARPRSLGELASETALELKRLHYHVTALRDLGLVIVKGKRARAGRAIKIYGAIASAFMVPASVSLNEPHVALMAELRKSLAQLSNRQAGTLYYLSTNGEPRMRPVPATGAQRPGATEHWRILKLSRTDLLRLSAAMEECLTPFAGPKPGVRQTYVVHFAIAPREVN
jgi:DNA-binding transcriptional ArsR family regulator